MKAYYGVSTLLPFELIERLPKSTTWGVVPPAPTVQLVFVMGTDELRGNRVVLEAHPGTAIVFDSRMNARSLGIPVLNLDKPLMPQLNTCNALLIVRRDPVKRLLAQTHRSFVGAFLTHAYRVRDAEQQQRLRDDVFCSVWENSLHKVCKKYAGRKEIAFLLGSPMAQNLCNAVQELRNGVSARRASQAHQISAFDLNYIAKFIERKNPAKHSKRPNSTI